MPTPPRPIRNEGVIMRLWTKRSINTAAVWSAIVAVCLFDAVTPLGVPVPVLYIVPVILAAAARRSDRFLLTTGIVITILVVFELRPHAASLVSFRVAVFNRTLHLTAVWMAIAVGLVLRRSSRTMRELL